MFLRNLYTSTFLCICLLVTTAVQKIVKAKIHRDTCTSSSSEAPGRHERRGARLLVRPLDRQHIWISQQPQLSWCKKLGEPANPLYHKGHKHHNMLHTGGVKRDLWWHGLFHFPMNTGRVSERPWRQQRCEVPGQQNDICSQVQVGQCEGEDDQLHWEYLCPRRQVRNEFLKPLKLTLQHTLCFLCKSYSLLQ